MRMNDLEELYIPSTFETACQTDNSTPLESPWNMIIINQLPVKIDENKLFSLFSQYGIIDNTYLCSEADSLKKPKHERIARITFRNEESAWKVWDASQNKLIKYDDCVLAITVASNDYSPIQNLPDTCLQEIFKRVNFVMDKFHVEMVCKRWKANGRSTWSNITEIGYNEFNSKTWRVISDRVLKLEGVELSLYPVDEERILEALAKRCIDLKRLGVYFLEYDENSLNYRQRIPRISRFIEQTKNLQRMAFCLLLPLVDDSVLKFMEFLPAGLVEIDIHAEEQTIPPTIVLSTFKNLRVLILNGVIMKNERSIDDLVTLERLSLSDCEIPDSVFLQILETNKGLKHLHISTKVMSDELFVPVQQLEKLQVFVLTVDKFNDANLGAMTPKLKGLLCCSYDLTEKGLQEFFNSVVDIKKLCFKHSPITSKFVSIAREWTERTGKFLELSVIPDFYTRSPKLEFQDTDKLKVIIFKGNIHTSEGKYWGPEFIE